MENNVSLHGRDLKDLVILELCCGTAGVTAAFRKAGLSGCVAVDKIKQRNAKASVIQLDLTCEADQRLVLQWIMHDSVVGVFCAPPCGTASAARQIDLPNEPNAPQPLRSVLEPDGFAYLSGTDSERVSLANKLYSFCAQTANLCHELGKLVMVENPRNSLFWLTSFWVEAACAKSLIFQDHQACGYGSSRPKWTRLAANFQEVCLISNVCPGNHRHEPWGVVAKGTKKVFATSLEVHYPPLLCEAIVQAFLSHLVLQGCVDTVRLPPNPAAQILTGIQPKSGKMLPAIPEHKSKILVLKDSNQKVLWPVKAPNTSTFKLLHSFSVGDNGMDQLIWSLDQACVAFRINKEMLPGKIPSDVVKLEIFGVPWSPMEFVNQAREFVHPLAVERALPAKLIDAIESHNSLSEVDVAKNRLRQVLFWNSRAKALDESEKLLKSELDPVVATAVRQKRLLLFEEMLHASGYPDIDVVTELRKGSSLVGDVPVTGVLPCKFSPATSSVDSLHTQSSFVRSKAERIASTSGNVEVDRSVWSQTMSEVEAGWIRGPLSLADIPRHAPITRRFGLVQGDKIRLIDDYSLSGVNACVTSAESPALHTIDTAGALLCKWLSMRSSSNLCPELVARTFDLKSAYRQIGLSPEGRQYSYFAVYNPDNGETCFFQALVLPFGATRSVHSFLRIARSIWWLGVCLFQLLWTSFYDDYILFSPPGLSSNAEQTAKSLLRLLGWVFAEDGKKAQPFSPICPALGVVFDLSLSGAGRCFIKNTDKRILEVCDELEKTIRCAQIKGSEARKLHGRMVFADAQLFGRTGKRCMRVISQCSERLVSKLDEGDLFFLKLFCDSLKSGPPRELRCQSVDQVLIFSDACYERDAREWKCGIGGVMHDPISNSWEFFSVEISDEQLMMLGESSKSQMIFEAETLASLVSFVLWSEKFKDRRCHLFADNEGTKFCLLKGSSDNYCVNNMVRLFALHESKVHSFVWISRVASASNIADGPSRNECSELKQLRAVNVSNLAKTLMDDTITQVELGGGAG